MPNAVVLSVAAKIIDKTVGKQMAKIEESGLKEWLGERRLSVRGFAKQIDVSSTTVDSWIASGRLTKVAKKAIEAGLIRMALDR